MSRLDSTVLIYPCTLVGYVRLLLISAALTALIFPATDTGALTRQWIFLSCIIASLLLDLLDGYLARKYNHTTGFGTLFDLMLDLATHTIVWLASGWQFAVVFIILEWAAGILAAATSLRSSDASWKRTFNTEAWGPIRYYFSRHQRNLLSTYSNMAHFIFPAALYLGLTDIWIYVLTAPGLFIYEAVTLVMAIMMIARLKYKT